MFRYVFCFSMVKNIYILSWVIPCLNLVGTFVWEQKNVSSAISCLSLFCGLLRGETKMFIG